MELLNSYQLQICCRKANGARIKPRLAGRCYQFRIPSLNASFKSTPNDPCPHLFQTLCVYLQPCWMTYVAKVTWASVGHLTPEWMKPGIIFSCCLVTYRIVSTQLLSLGNLKIRCNCTDKSGDYTTPCPSKSRSQSVYLCLCVAAMKYSILFQCQRYISVKPDFSFWSGWRATPPLSCAGACN